MQNKTNTLAQCSSSIGLHIHREKSKIIRFSAANITPVLLDGQELEEVDYYFTYLGSTVDKKGGTGADVISKIGKAVYSIS
jgi:hypothetical protein